MPAMLQKPARRVAIADDNPDYLIQKSQVIQMAGYEPVKLSGHYHAVGELLAELRRVKAGGLVCDHKLSEGNYAQFDGAEVVAALYGSDTPALLVTDYVESDLNSIRKYRRKVPVLIRGGKFTHRAVIKGLEDWEEEVIRNNTPLQRRPRRAVVMIDDIAPGGKWRMLTVFVPRWREHEAIPLSEELIPEPLRKSLKKGTVLTANINTEAERMEDLYFEDFRLTPDEDLQHEPA
jgi:hypothetical protein